MHPGRGGAIYVHGARRGRLRVAAATADPARVPDWMVAGPDVPQLPVSDAEPGLDRGETCLFGEVCAEVHPVELLEAWVRHSLLGIHRLEDDGGRALQAA